MRQSEKTQIIWTVNIIFYKLGSGWAKAELIENIQRGPDITVIFSWQKIRICFNIVFELKYVTSMAHLSKSNPVCLKILGLSVHFLFILDQCQWWSQLKHTTAVSDNNM